MTAKVYFSREISPEKVVEMYRKLGIELPGKVAVKVHSGEKGNQNFLRPEFWRPMVEAVDGTIVECNTAYGDFYGNGVRDQTAEHWKLIEYHGWSKLFEVDLMDAEGPDLEWAIPNGKVLKSNLVGKNIVNYDSMLVLAHFKGHPMGGYGGALKQLSIGCASRAGKSLIHSGGATDSNMKAWDLHAGEALRRQDRVCQRDEEPLRRLRLLRSRRGPLHGGYRHPRVPRPRRHRPGVHRPRLRIQGPGPRPLHRARRVPPRRPHHRSRRGAGFWLP